MENPKISPPLGILPSATPVRASFDTQPDSDGFVWVKASSVAPSSHPTHSPDVQPHQAFGDVEGHTLWMIRHSKYIDVHLYNDPHIDTIFDELDEILPELATQAYQVPVHLHLGQRDLSVLNMKRIIAVFRATWSSTITKIHCTDAALRRFAAQQFRCQFQLTESEMALADVPTPVLNLVKTPQSVQSPDTMSVHHKLHPGSIIRSEGDVIVYGSVPKGCILESAGSITVLGGLYGEAHAGIMGDEEAFVLALTFGPERVQIAHHRCYTDPFREPCQATKISILGGQLSVSEFALS
jgi:septum formation inhibitor MinC